MTYPETTDAIEDLRAENRRLREFLLDHLELLREYDQEERANDEAGYVPRYYGFDSMVDRVSAALQPGKGD